MSTNGMKKQKHFIVFNPKGIADKIKNNENFLLEKFHRATSAQEQYKILRNFFKEYPNRESNEQYVKGVKDLAYIFFHMSTMNTVKLCILSHVLEMKVLQNPFEEFLSQEMKIAATKSKSSEDYSDVYKIASCIENFYVGMKALKKIHYAVINYLKSCLTCCVLELRDDYLKAPTEKSEIFTLAHTALNLLLHIYQNVNVEEISGISVHFAEINSSIKDLLFNDDVPIDLKFIGGIVCIKMYIFEFGSDSWIQILQNTNEKNNLADLVRKEAAVLFLYTGVVTVVPLEIIHAQCIEDKPAILVMTTRMLEIGEKNSSDSTLILVMARSILEISKTLLKTKDHKLGQELAEHILVFVWAHLDHYLVCVRDLTKYILYNVVKFCAKLKNEGNDKLLGSLLKVLLSLDRTKKAFYISVTSLIENIGVSDVLSLIPNLVRDTTEALSVQALQASATATLKAIMNHPKDKATSESVYSSWVQTFLYYVESSALQPGVINVLENLLTKNVHWNESMMNYIFSLIKNLTTSIVKPSILKCILLLLNVVRIFPHIYNMDINLQVKNEWKGVVSYELLKRAAVDADDEIRTLSISLIVKSQKKTEVFTEDALNFVLYFLKYNINSQSPSFRQFILGLMKTCLKRLEDSYKVLKRQNDSSESIQFYVEFMDKLRSLCFDSMLSGANYNRRCIALQTILMCENICIAEYQRRWTEMHIERLLLHLEDTYESNKANAVNILVKCPEDLLRNGKYSMSLELNDILRQASSYKPTDCTSASYKLYLLLYKLPDHIPHGDTVVPIEPLPYVLIQKLLVQLKRELSVCRTSVVLAASGAPMYGTLHCVRYVMDTVDPDAISGDHSWTCLIDDLFKTCIEVNDAVSSVVNNSSPEGHLPMDLGGVAVTDHGNLRGVRLKDGRQVTAQMVLLCAWRSCKEVSLLLGVLCSKLNVYYGRNLGTLQPKQLIEAGAYFIKMLMETKHRGAFEQAHVGFASLLRRLWHCEDPQLNTLPLQWLSELMATIATPENSKLCATRRSAGLPYMIQALAAAELHVLGNTKGFHQCMSTLLRLARPFSKTTPTVLESDNSVKKTDLERSTLDPDEGDASESRTVETRTHAFNILRALFRDAELDEHISSYVSEGIMLAILGFEADTWAERNSSTLLFSALMVRVFGVQRSRDSEKLSIRNRMTGRVFFMRYPQLYDFMLDKLQEVSKKEDNVIQPSLYPILLLLARLYPSALEGTVSNLKLVSFVPHVLHCAKSCVLKTRQLAAKAIVPLVSPELHGLMAVSVSIALLSNGRCQLYRYMRQIEMLFQILCDESIKRNYCHGVLLQLTKLLENKPETLGMDAETESRFKGHLMKTLWIIEQTTCGSPCYLITDQYLKVLNSLIRRLPNLLETTWTNAVNKCLKDMVFGSTVSRINSGRDVCLSNAFYLHLIIHIKLNNCTETKDLILNALKHQTYEVVLATLNYLLIAQNKADSLSCALQEHLAEINSEHIIESLRDDASYVKHLCGVLENATYPECTQKCLEILAYEENTENYIVGVKRVGDAELILNTWITFIQNEYYDLTHVYLLSLSKYVSRKLKQSELKTSSVLNVIRLLYDYSSSGNNYCIRAVVVEFMENNYELLRELNVDDLLEEDQFEYKATLWATLAILLEDDEVLIRQRISRLLVKGMENENMNVVSTRAAEVLRDLVGKSDDALALYLLLALLDFRNEVVLERTEEGDECRVFDQNEKYNVFLEESVWSVECAARVIQTIHTSESTNTFHWAEATLTNNIYKKAFKQLCSGNALLFKQMVEERCVTSVDNNLMNPKIKLLYKELFG